MTMTRCPLHLLPALLLAATTALHAQAPAPAAPPDPNSVASLSWLYGCWGGTVNQRSFREQWMPMRGGVMHGIG